MMPHHPITMARLFLLLLLLFAVYPCHGVAQPIAREGASPLPWVTRQVSAPGVEFHTFESRLAKTTVSFHIYKPAAYNAEPQRRFPVLYWLHGTGGGLPGIAPLSRLFDDAIRAGKIPPMLIVFANGLATSMWCDSKDGAVPMESLVITELVPHVDASFRTIGSRRGRLIEGFSMGGYGAARLGFTYPDLFGAVSILAGGPLDLEFAGPRAMGNPREREYILRTFGSDLDYFKAQSPIRIAERHADAIRGAVRVRIVVGTRDATYPLNAAYSEHLTALHIPHTFESVPSVAHDTPALLNELGDNNWAFYRAVFADAAPRESAASPQHSR